MPLAEAAVPRQRAYARATRITGGVCSRLARAARAVPWQPWSILGPLVLVQWVAVLAFALTVRHNGWLYYQGGDESIYYTTAWSLGQAYLPVTSIGWGWPMLLSPVAAIAGPSFLSALPAIIVIQTVLLLPIALASVYSIAARLGGRLLGYWAAAAWIAAPFAAILVADPRYHERWIEQFLPQALGLTGLADFPSMVTLLAGTALILRSLETRARADTALAALVVGFTISIKPANSLFLVGAALAFLFARRVGQALLFAAVLAPAIVALAVWKQRGLGELPLFALGTHALAAGAGLSLPTPPSVIGAVVGTSYVHLNWHLIDQNLIALREYFWSTRVYQVLPFIGAAALLRRSRPAAALVVGWFAAFFLIKGSNQYATVDSGSFFRFLMPALPAYLLLATGIPLLVPGIGRRLAASGAALPARKLPAPRLSLGCTAAVLLVLPLLLIAAAPHLPRAKAVKYFTNGTYVTITAPAPTASATSTGVVTLGWTPPATAGIHVWFKVLRSNVDPVICQSSGGTADCSMIADLQEVTNLHEVTTTRELRLTDSPGAGTWWYSVGVLANWLDDPTKGDVLQFLKPVRVDVSTAG